MMQQNVLIIICWWCRIADTTFRMSVDYGKTYLLRIVNSVQNTDMFFSIADHNLTVVGWDGSYVKPLPVTFIMITPGQTMDVWSQQIKLLATITCLPAPILMDRQMTSTRASPARYYSTTVTTLPHHRRCIQPTSRVFTTSPLRRCTQHV